MDLKFAEKSIKWYFRCSAKFMGEIGSTIWSVFWKSLRFWQFWSVHLVQIRFTRWHDKWNYWKILHTNDRFQLEAETTTKRSIYAAFWKVSSWNTLKTVIKKNFYIFSTSTTLKIGICVPSTCSKVQVTEMASKILDMKNLTLNKNYNQEDFCYTEKDGQIEFNALQIGAG